MKKKDKSQKKNINFKTIKIVLNQINLQMK